MRTAGLEEAVDSGSWQEWDRVWRRMGRGGSGRVLYTEGTPATLLEFWQRAYADDLWELVGKLGPAARLLELGSGRATTSMYLASRHRDVTLVDRSSAGLDLATENFKRHGLKPPRIHLADARHTGLASNAYDCVYNIGLLEHFDDPVPILAEALRVLKPGGCLFMVIVPQGSPWLSLPIRLTLNPLATVGRLIAAAARRIAGGVRHMSGTEVETSEEATFEGLRTDHSRAQYVQWMRQLGETDVQCVPYNPYLRLYQSASLERVITVPLYRMHLRLKRTWATYPLLRVDNRFASCDLLLCRKGGERS